jgi:hypothetical protein
MRSNVPPKRRQLLIRRHDVTNQNIAKSSITGLENMKSQAQYAYILEKVVVE